MHQIIRERADAKLLVALRSRELESALLDVADLARHLRQLHTAERADRAAVVCVVNLLEPLRHAHEPLGH